VLFIGGLGKKKNKHRVKWEIAHSNDLEKKVRLYKGLWDHKGSRRKERGEETSIQERVVQREKGARLERRIGGGIEIITWPMKSSQCLNQFNPFS